MPKIVIQKALGVLKAREFVAFATANAKGKPNSAPKFLLKVEGNEVFFVDYAIGNTAENLKINPQAALSTIDLDSLVGYRLFGRVELIENGPAYDQCLKELQEKEIQLSVERIVKGVEIGKPHKEFELDIPDKFLVYKVKVEEGSEISPRGEIQRENI